MIRMAVYGIGLIIRLLEELQKQDFDPLGVRPQDPLIRQLMDAENRSRESRKPTFTMDELREIGKQTPPKKKRKASAYSKRYGKAFKRLAPKFKKKNGSWKKNGFKNCAKAARKEAKK